MASTAEQSRRMRPGRPGMEVSGDGPSGTLAVMQGLVPPGSVRAACCRRGRERRSIARALAQQPWCVLLDEPTNHLDTEHQLALMNLLAATDQTVLVALHDLSLAARYCDRLVLMSGGTLVADGTPEEVLTPGRLRAVFEVEAQVALDPLGDMTITYTRPGATTATAPAPPG